MSLPAPSATIAAASAPAPIDADERLHSLDILRGLALAGMILVHFHQRLERPITGARGLDRLGSVDPRRAEGVGNVRLPVRRGVRRAAAPARGARDDVVPVYLRRLAGLAAVRHRRDDGTSASRSCSSTRAGGSCCCSCGDGRRGGCSLLAVVAACARPIVAEATALYHWWTASRPPPGRSESLGGGTRGGAAPSIRRGARGALGNVRRRPAASMAGSSAELEPHAVHPRPARRASSRDRRADAARPAHRRVDDVRRAVVGAVVDGARARCPRCRSRAPTGR